MKTKLLSTMLAFLALPAFAVPPEAKAGGGKWGEMSTEQRAKRMEARGREERLRYAVAISDALELNEAESLKLVEKLKSSEEKRRPLRQSMWEAMKAIRDAADGDPAALSQLDANIQKVLDGRAQIAALDKELFATLAQGYPPQKRAKLALALGRLHMEGRGGGRWDRAGRRKH